MFMVHSNYCPLFRGENPLHLLVAIQLVDVFVLQSATGSQLLTIWFHGLKPSLEKKLSCCLSESLEIPNGVCQDREHF